MNDEEIAMVSSSRKTEKTALHKRQDMRHDEQWSDMGNEIHWEWFSSTGWIRWLDCVCTGTGVRERSF
jgi:hypothetical protein